MTYDFHGDCPDGTRCWYGEVHDCSLEGNIRFVADRPAWLKGHVLHFYERFTIYPEDGDGAEIQGTTAGAGHPFPPFSFVANGWVTDAEGEWEYLIGNKYFEMGTSTDPFSPPVTVVDMVMRIVPAHRPMP
jgi:hypothetical protein